MREEQDKKLADRGWQSMQQLLDRDMPAERKRRPIAWWWLGLLLLPLAILGSRAWWQTESMQPAEPAPAVLKTDRPVVLQSTDRQHTVSQNATEHTPAAQLDQTQKSVEGTVYAAPQLSAAGRPIQHHTTTTPATVMQPSAVATSMQHPKTDIAFVSPEKAAVVPSASAEPVSVLPENQVTIAATGKDFADALQPLETPLQPVEKENTFDIAARSFPAYTAEKPVIQPLKASPKWAFGLSAATSTEYFESLNTISGGVTTDWRFARKLGLRSSVLYTRYRPTASRQPVVAVEEVQYSNATGLYTGAYTAPSNIQNSEQNEYVYIPLRKLHQVEIPLLAWWQPLRKLRVYSGISVDYTFLGQSAQQNYIDNALVSLDTYDSRKSAGQVATQELNRWQFQYQGGVGLRLGRHAELSAFWKAPLRNIFPKRNDLASFNSATAQFNDPTLSDNSINSNSLPRTGRLMLQGTWLF